MKEKFFGIGIVGALLSLVAMLTATAALGNPTVFPTGTTIYNPQKAHSMYVLFGGQDGKAHLIDMNGNDVRQWEKTGFPTEMIDPAISGGKKGNILVQLENGPSPFGNIFNNKRVGELDWNGKIVWQWGGEGDKGTAHQNHDWARLPNGNTILVTTYRHVVPSISAEPIGDQKFVEVTPDGKIVWTWVAGDHIDEYGISEEGWKLLRLAYAKGSPGTGGFLTINDLQPIGPNKWFDAGDTRFHPDNIVIDSREVSFTAIIEKSTGKIVWRLGPDFASEADATGGTAVTITAVQRPVLKSNVPRPVDQTSGQHDAHIIPRGLPGEGNLLVFDNEGPSGYPSTRLASLLGSRVLEIDPITKQIVWQYTATNSQSPLWTFFSSFISSAQRLPNGNTLICEGMNGRIFQVTPAGEIVWEYVSPYYGEQTMMHPTNKVKSNWVFRAQPVPYNWVPDGTPRSETAVKQLDNATYRVAGQCPAINCPATRRATKK